MKQLLPNQTLFSDKIYIKMEQGETTFFICGNSGCGKTVSLQSISKNFEDSGYLPIFLKGDPVLSSSDYLPFYNALSDILPSSAVYGNNQVLIDCVENIPEIGKKITTILKIFAKKNEAQKGIRDLSLNEKEQDIICKLQYLSERREIIFVCENINYWDEKSLKLLYTILTNKTGKYDFFSKCIFFIIHTNNKPKLHDDLIMAIKNLDGICSLNFPGLEYIDFRDALKILGYKNELSERECEILYSLINGHIRMLVDLINELNRNKLTLNTIEGKPKEVLTEILKRRLVDCGATGDQIKITLEYASLLGLTFSSYELNQIMQIGNSSFQKIITRSNEMNLIEETGEKINSLQFAHDIIHEIFENEISENGEDYYKRIELCLKEIEPGQFIRRANYASKSGDYEKALILFVLEIIKQIREEGDISTTNLEKCKNIFNEDSGYSSFYEYIMSIRKGYCLYRKGNYAEALNELLTLDSIFPAEFLAEKEILCSYCYTKKLDANYRDEGLARLIDFSSIEKCSLERDIYERVLIRLMILYVHLGDIDSAHTVEKQIVDSLKERFNHDDSAQMRFYTLSRISNSIYSCEIAANKMKKAVDYFGTNYEKGGLWRDIKQYYLSQVNYAGVLCLNGRFFESYQRNVKILELYQQFPDYPFPRPNILLNNYLTSGYLSHQLTIAECVDAYREFVMSLDVCAERLFYVSNYSIFLALSGHVKEALYALQNEGSMHNVEKDKEKLYNYRVSLNTSVYYYLLGFKDTALMQLINLKEQMDLTSIKNDTVHDYKRVIKIIEHITNSTQCNNPMQWENVLLKNSSAFQSNAWNYYGKGYAFTTVFNWDL